MNRLVRVRNDHNKTMSASLSSKTNTDQLITKKKKKKKRAKFPEIVFPNQLADKAQQLVEWCPGATIKC